MKTLKALRSADDADGMVFSGLSGLQRFQRFREDAMFKEGDSVVVKPGIVDPDFGTEIGGWQGRILGIGPDREDTVLIGWDSITLKDMPGSVIEQSEEQGLDWTKMYLDGQEVELTSPRDTEEDVARAINELSKEYAWSYLGEEGKRIGKVLAGVDEDDEMGALDAWEEHLSKSLVFPFEAKVAEYQERGPLQAGDRVKVTGIGLVDDLYGIIVDLRRGRRKYALPLCDLEVTDKHSPNQQIVRDYAVWFANRQREAKLTNTLEEGGGAVIGLNGLNGKGDSRLRVIRSIRSENPLTVILSGSLLTALAELDHRGNGGTVIGLGERIERKRQLWIGGTPLNPLWESVDSNPLTALTNARRHSYVRQTGQDALR